MKRVIIIGASSGIGAELARVFSKSPCKLGLVARRLPLLETLKKELPVEVHLASLDVTKPDEIPAALEQLVERLGGLDILIIGAGTGHLSCDWDKEHETIQTNVVGFCAVANWGMKFFMHQGQGHIVGISSIAALRGSGSYSASKAFVSNYLEGLAKKAYRSKQPITISDIRPGFMDTSMAKGAGIFWLASVQRASQQIYEAILKKKRVVYITKRWRIIAFLLKDLPFALYRKI